jgi:protein gp37
MTMAARLKLMGSAKYQRDGDPSTSGPGFGVTLHHGTLRAPLGWRKPRLVFVNSMSDVFHPEIPDGFIGSIFDVMALAERHTFQVLTKRPQRMAKLLQAWEADGCMWRRDDMLWCGPGPWPLPNVWLGTSIENDRYTFRVDHLTDTPAALRFLSLEPLLGPLPSLDLTGIGWVIAGAESGHGARPMDDGWVRDIRDQCVERGISFFFKQKATSAGQKIPLPELDGQVWNQMPAHAA